MQLRTLSETAAQLNRSRSTVRLHDDVLCPVRLGGERVYNAERVESFKLARALGGARP